jgi:hypothetical protein
MRHYKLSNSVRVSIPEELAVKYELDNSLNDHDFVSTLAAIVSAQEREGRSWVFTTTPVKRDFYNEQLGFPYNVTTPTMSDADEEKLKRRLFGDRVDDHYDASIARTLNTKKPFTDLWDDGVQHVTDAVEDKVVEQGKQLAGPDKYHLSKGAYRWSSLANRWVPDNDPDDYQGADHE